jgi:hypothetical protein
MSLAILFYFLCTQHVSDINISIVRSLRLCCWITTGWRTTSACNTDTTQSQPNKISNTQRNKNQTTDVVIQQHSCELLMMDILMSETCWVHRKWNKTASDIKLVFYSSTIKMMHAPINVSASKCLDLKEWWKWERDVGVCHLVLSRQWNHGCGKVGHVAWVENILAEGRYFGKRSLGKPSRTWVGNRFIHPVVNSYERK